MIELDVSTPWVPPDPPAGGRVRPRWRWVSSIVVLVVALGLLGGAVPRPAPAPVFTVDHQVLGVNAAGGRLFVRRYQGSAAGSHLDALRLSDGAPLWSTSIDLNQHFRFVSDQVVVLLTESGDGSGQENMITVLDAATGKRLWERRTARLIGVARGLIVVEDLIGMTLDQAPQMFTGDELDVNQAAEYRDARYLGLTERTGATEWTIDVPKGTATDFTWSGGGSTGLSGFAELSPTGLLTVRDLATGGVTERHQLEWSGTVGSFSTGGSYVGGAAPSREGAVVSDLVLIFTAGERGADAYDRHSGKRLWHWVGRPYSGLFGCAVDRYCSITDKGMDSYDARSGRLVWHVDRYNLILRLDPQVMVLGSYLQSVFEPGGVTVVDTRTGAVKRYLEGWRVIQGPVNNQLVVWKPVDPWHAVLGSLDPASGSVTVIGVADDWYGQPECTVDGDLLACVVVGGLSVWRLPSR